MSRRKNPPPSYLRALGMDRKITRRDFLNAALIGTGSALLLDHVSPALLFAQTRDWNGYGGEGDYAASHGNTEDIVRSAHAIRDNRFDAPQKDVTDTGETYDLVVIGGGLSGLGAAYHFSKAKRSGQKCLVLDNHPVFGGQAKRNEFMVNGQRLIGPQASNSFVVVDQPGASGYDLFEDLRIPRTFQYQRHGAAEGGLYFDRTNYGFMLWYDGAPSYGYFFGKKNGEWVKDLWSGGLERLPYPEKVRADFRTWRQGRKIYHEPEGFEQWLDSMTYRDYIEKIMKLNPEITKFVNPVLACAIGLGSDAVSAFGAFQVAMPGFQGFPRGFTRRAVFEENKWHSFPGGNDGFVRHLIKSLIPGAIAGPASFGEIMNRPIDFTALDRTENDVRIRLNSFAVRVEHESSSEKSEFVRVLYVRGGKVFSLRAQGVVMACGGLAARRVVAGIPGDYHEAYSQFHYSPLMIVNVALTNWRFLARLGLTACRWFEGFGFSCNIRRPMVVGDYRPPLDPDSPAVMTFYIPFYYPGLPLHEQGVRGRTELLATGFAEYEIKLREQMVRLFGKAGFDPKKDIAGIILNRWGHAFVNPQPGFYFGTAGKSAPRNLLRKRFGRIAFAHSELNGHQHWLGAIEEGRRAAKQIMSIL